MSIRFHVKLTQHQFLSLNHQLPKGYVLKKAKGRFINSTTHSCSESQKNQTPITSNSCSSLENLQTNHQSQENKSAKISKVVLKGKNSLQRPNQQDNFQLERKTIYQAILNEIKKKQSADIFIEPVDPVELKIPTYFKIIKEPMDLQTVSNKIKNNSYLSFEQFQKDLRKIVANCLTFNAGNNAFINIAKKFEKDYKSIISKNTKNIEKLTKKNVKQSREDYILQTHQSKKQIQSQSQFKNYKKNKTIKNKPLKIQKSKQLYETQVKNQLFQQIKNKEQETQKINYHFQEEESKQQKKQNNKLTNQNNSYNKDFNQESEGKLLKSKIIFEKDKKSKIFSKHERLNIIKRIRNLDKQSMGQFFKQIKFSRGESLDFKVLEDNKIQQILQPLDKYENLCFQKQNLVKNSRIEKLNDDKVGQQFEIAQDEDYDD